MPPHMAYVLVCCMPCACCMLRDASTAHHHTPNPTRILIPIHTHPQLYNKPQLHSESERARERGSERERASDGRETRQGLDKETLPHAIAASYKQYRKPSLPHTIGAHHLM